MTLSFNLELEDSSTNAPLTGISLLTSLPTPLPAHNIPATSFTLGLVHQPSTDYSGFFKAPNPLYLSHLCLLYRLPSQRNLWMRLHHNLPFLRSRRVSNVKDSSAMAKQSIQAVVSQVKVPTLYTGHTSTGGGLCSKVLFTSSSSGTGTDTSASSFSSTSKPEHTADIAQQVAPLNLPFRELVQKVKEYLSIPDPAAEENYKLGSSLGCYPLLLKQEKFDRPPSIKLSMVADLSRLQPVQDESVKPSKSQYNT